MVNHTPTSLSEALHLMATGEHTPYAGGTDLMVSEKLERPFVYLHKTPELKVLEQRGNALHIGTALSYSELLASECVPAILKEAIAQIAAPAIRNTATLGGNIANASSKGDGALICAVTDCELVLASSSGTRTVAIGDFFLGRNKTVLTKDELLVEIVMPLGYLQGARGERDEQNAPGEQKSLGALNAQCYQFTKVGPRRALAISRVSFAGIISVQDGVVQHLATAFGAVANCVLRPRELDSSFVGLEVAKAKEHIPTYIEELAQLIQPIKGRVSAEYRKNVCINLVRDFLQKQLDWV